MTKYHVTQDDTPTTKGWWTVHRNDVPMWRTPTQAKAIAKMVEAHMEHLTQELAAFEQRQAVNPEYGGW